MLGDEMAIVGIDLGTTNSCVAVVREGEPLVIPSAEGARTIPSIVAFVPSGERLVGHVARRQAQQNPKDTIFAVKRLMGRRYDSPEARRQAELVPYRIVPAMNGDAWVQAGGKEHAPPEVSALVLEQLKRRAEEYLGEEVTEAVITVPAYFDDAQRQATRDAGRIAGLQVRRIVNEPTAAALAYGFDKQGERQRIVVYDLGGGTFDVSLLEVGDGVFQVRATAGDTYLGGEDIDNRLVEHLVAAFQEHSGIDVSSDGMAMHRLREAAQTAKHELSTSLQTTVNLPFLAMDAQGQPAHLEVELKRADLEILARELVERTLEPCAQVLRDAGWSQEELDAVVLVGGQTRMPLVQRMVAEFFGKEPHKGVDPDEVVAVGAALQAAALSGEVEEVLLLDVLPLSLGVETAGGVATVLIPRNTTIPTQAKEVFTTSVDNQDFVPVHVLQGERPMAADNKTLARFELAPIPPAPRGVPQIEVTFDVDQNGIVRVTAKDLGTGREQGIQVVASSGLSEDEIQRLVQEAERHREGDEKRKQLAELRSRAEGLLYTTERTVEECAGLVEEALLEAVRADAAMLRARLEEGADALAIQEALEATELSAYQLAEAMYGVAAEEGESEASA